MTALVMLTLLSLLQACWIWVVHVLILALLWQPSCAFGLVVTRNDALEMVRFGFGVLCRVNCTLTMSLGEAQAGGVEEVRQDDSDLHSSVEAVDGIQLVVVQIDSTSAAIPEEARHLLDILVFCAIRTIPLQPVLPHVELWYLTFGHRFSQMHRAHTVECRYSAVRGVWFPLLGFRALVPRNTRVAQIAWQTQLVFVVANPSFLEELGRPGALEGSAVTAVHLSEQVAQGCWTRSEAQLALEVDTLGQPVT